jgi:hypothetical protein
MGMLVFATSVVAVETPPTTSATSDSTSTATNQGNTVTFTSPADTHQTVDGTQVVKNTPSVNGPPLTTSNDTCMGSTSGSMNIAGLGIGGGSTWVDGNCKLLKNSRELWNMGMKAASMAMLCKDPDMREALEETGYKCPPVKPKQVVTIPGFTQ